MRSIIIALGIICLATTTFAVLPAQPLIPVSTVAPPPTLAQDLEEITLLIPTNMIMKLVTRYLLNDAEFQAVVRLLNSYDAFMVQMRIRSQPEIIMFQSWVRQQLLLSGGSFEMEESMELNIFNASPYWANTVYGWTGFINELMSYYPVDLIVANINMKIASSGIFAQFWTRVQGLKPVYERILAFPETNRLIQNLTTIGVDTNQLDHLIRTQFGWTNPPVAAPVAPGASIPAASGVAAPAAQAPLAG